MNKNITKFVNFMVNTQIQYFNTKHHIYKLYNKTFIIMKI